MVARGKFIVLEGGEGCGKSTQAELLATHLGAQCTREPGGTQIGESIRAILLERGTGSLDPRAELMLMLAARAQHVSERIRPWLDAGRDVVCDRFSGSTLAYQGHGRGLPLDEVAAANDLCCAGLQPDLVVLLDLPTEAGAARREAPDDRFEKEDGAFFSRVADGFQEIARGDPDRWVIVDASGAIDEVARRVRAAVAERLGMFGVDGDS
ncbi:MAG TPA: dTMP kinase [Acidimicrobiales bacterium]|nr:dTMP kinase [Acidimicrobiales bacterium]